MAYTNKVVWFVTILTSFTRGWAFTGSIIVVGLAMTMTTTAWTRSGGFVFMQGSFFEFFIFRLNSHGLMSL